MKKILFLISLSVIIFSQFFYINAFADDVTLVINGSKVVCDVPPVISNGRTLVPVRALFEHLNADVSWNGVLRQVIVTSDSKMIIFNVDSRVAHVNGQMHNMETAPVIVNDRTLIPVRFVSENLGYTVDWEGETRTVIVKDAGGNDNTSNSAGTQNTVISKISVSETESKYKVSVSMSDNVVPVVTTLENPHRVIFDFYGVKLSCSGGKTKSDMTTISETRWAEHSEYTRVVVESYDKIDYTADYSSGKYVITVKKAGSSADAPIVIVDAGHGGYDPGAVGRDDDGNIILSEKDVTLNIAKKVKKLLSDNGVSVIMTRSSDTALGDTQSEDLYKRAGIANDAGASIFVSIHTNAFSDPSASGTCVLYAGLASNPVYGISSKQVAEYIKKPLVEFLGIMDRGIIARPNVVVLRETAMPAVLVECAFISSPDDQKILSDESKLNGIAQAISDGVIKSLREMGRLK